MSHSKRLQELRAYVQKIMAPFTVNKEKKTFSLAARAKTPSGGNWPKNKKHQGKDVKEFKKEKEKQANSCVRARTHAQESQQQRDSFHQDWV